MHHRKTLLTALGLACGPLVALADPLLSLGQQTPVWLTAAATLRHDDNIFLAPQNQESDLILVFMPGIEIQSNGANTIAELKFNEQFVSYMSNSELGSNLASLSGRLASERPRSSWSLNADYTELDQNDFNARNINQSVRRNLTDLAAKVSWGVTAKTSVGTGVEFNRTEYPGSGNVDSDVWTAPIDWYYAVSPKIDLSAGYRYRENQLEGMGKDSTDHFANVGARGHFTAKLDGQFRVGYTQREPEYGESSNLLGLSSALTYAATPKSTLEFSVSNDFDNSASGASQKTLRLAVTGSYALTPVWSASTDVSFESSKELSASARTDKFWVGTIGTSYSFSLNTSVHLSYLYRTNDSNVEAVSFNNNVVSVSASVRF